MSPPALFSGCFGGAYKDKRVLVTGHTGFKGAWLCEWLVAMGAEVYGFSLAPPTSPSLFEQLNLGSRMVDAIGDVRDESAVKRAVQQANPDYVFHLAAQPLVRFSYAEPVATYASNVMGTVHVLDALRAVGRPCIALVVTTDKCYENKEWVHSYREDDPMGGYDPYSSSKGAAELVISAYRRSFFSPPSTLNAQLPSIRLASARAGNVIGGGDWALDRIVPDCIRALQRGEVIPVRNKIATRPWQHVLEPLSGYLWLAACLAQAAFHVESGGLRSAESRDSVLNLNLKSERLKALCGAFNFGPSLASNRTVADLVQEILRHWPGRWEDKSDPHAVHEAKLLNLATDKAHHFLGWSPVWSFADTIAQTVGWYRSAVSQPAEIHALTTTQIQAYTAAAHAKGNAWAQA